jgi:hypothetical protein
MANAKYADQLSDCEPLLIRPYCVPRRSKDFSHDALQERATDVPWISDSISLDFSAGLFPLMPGR